MTNSFQEHLQSDLSPHPELRQLNSSLTRLLSLVAHQTRKLHELQNELAILKHERETLLAERELLHNKINAAQSHIHAMLEQLPTQY